MSVIVSECVAWMRTQPDASFDAVVTDPPYGLAPDGLTHTLEEIAEGKAKGGFMGAAWDAAVPGETVWKEVLRLLKPGGYVAAFGGTRTQHRMVYEAEKSGLLIRDGLAWLYGSGMAKGPDMAKLVDERMGVKGTLGEYKTRDHASKRKMVGSMHEGWERPWMHNEDKRANAGREYIPASAEGAAWKGWGTTLRPGWEPIMLARSPLSEKTVVDNVLKHGTGALNVDAARLPLSDGDERKIGRWPTNVAHDGSGDVAAELGFDDDGGVDAVRFFYCAKPSREEREVGLEGFEIKLAKNSLTSHNGTGDFRGVDGKPLARRANIHPTVKPVALMLWIVKLLVRPGGRVLDPFCGSGTTGMACAIGGFDFVGVEMNPEFAEIARARIAAAAEGRIRVGDDKKVVVTEPAQMKMF